MQQLNDYQIKQIESSKLINLGNYGYIHEYKAKAIKLFSDYLLNSGEIRKIYLNKQAKLEILQKLDLPFYVKVHELYSYNNGDYDILCAYLMDYLKDNKLNNFDPKKYSLTEKNVILSKILQVITMGNKYNIYNFDLNLSNFYLSPTNEMVGLDVDNLKILLNQNCILPIDEKRKFITSYEQYTSPSKNKDLIIQNYAFLILCLTLWIDLSTCLWFPEANYLLNFVENLCIDNYTIQIMKAIIEGEHNVDLQQLLEATSSNDIFIKLKTQKKQDNLLKILKKAPN